MKGKKLKLDDLISEKSLNFISQEEIISILGGTDYYPGSPVPPSWDCVLNCFDYLDGSAHDYDFYRYSINYNLGYDPSGTGGVYTSQISTVGNFGGMAVNEITGSSFSITSNGTINGSKAIMTFNAGVQGSDHAVVINGYEYVNGQLQIRYYDPTTGLPGLHSVTGVTIYTVGAVGSYTGS